MTERLPALPGGTVGNLGLDIRLVRGLGGRAWDEDGREYVDFLLGSGPLIIGNAVEEVVEAVREQAGRGSTFFGTTPLSVEFAERIVEAVPGAEQARFAGSATEAVVYAMRLARAETGRSKVLKFEGSFHGLSDHASVSWTPATPAVDGRGTLSSAGVPGTVMDDVIVSPFNDLARAQELIEAHAHELAAVIVEPVQRVIPPAPGFLQGVRAATQQHGVALIFDEVVTGFRLAYGGAAEFYGVTPDLVTLGKALGGGYPIGVVAGKRAYLRHFEREVVGADGFVPMVVTFAGNPITAAAGLATLKLLQVPGTYERIHAVGARVRAGLESSLTAAGHDVIVSGVAPMFDALFTAQPSVSNYFEGVACDGAKSRRFMALLREHGVLKGDAKIYIAASHTEQDVADALAGINAAARALD